VALQEGATTKLQQALGDFRSRRLLQPQATTRGKNDCTHEVPLR